MWAGLGGNMMPARVPRWKAGTGIPEGSLRTADAKAEAHADAEADAHARADADAGCWLKQLGLLGQLSLLLFMLCPVWWLWGGQIPCTAAQFRGSPKKREGAVWPQKPLCVTSATLVEAKIHMIFKS